MEILEDPTRGTIVSNLAQVSISNKEEILELIALGS